MSIIVILTIVVDSMTGRLASLSLHWKSSGGDVYLLVYSLVTNQWLGGMCGYAIIYIDPLLSTHSYAFSLCTYEHPFPISFHLLS